MGPGHLVDETEGLSRQESRSTKENQVTEESKKKVSPYNQTNNGAMARAFCAKMCLDSLTAQEHRLYILSISYAEVLRTVYPLP